MRSSFVTRTRFAVSAARRQPGERNADWRPLGAGLWKVQVLKFLAVGVLNTGVDAILYLALTRWLGLAALPALAKGVSYSAGVVNSFYWNRTWTFRASNAGNLGTFVAFALANLAALGLNAGVMHLVLNVVGLPEAVAFVAATGVTFAWNFGLSKFVVFRSDTDATDSTD